MKPELALSRWPMVGLYAMALLLAAGAGGIITSLPGRADAAFAAPWWVLIPIAAGFGLAEGLLFRVDLRREGLSFSLSEVPTVFALAFLAPVVAIAVSVITGISVLIAITRPPIHRTIFNAALFAFSMAVGLSVTRQISAPGSEDLGRFLVAAAIGTAASTLVALILVCAVVSFFDEDFRVMIRSQFGPVFVGASTGALMGSIAVAPALIGLEYWPLSIVPVLAVWAILRRHGNLTRHHSELIDLHSFSAVLDQSLDLDLLAPRAVEEIGRLLKAEHVTLRLVRTAENESRTWHRGEVIDIPRVPALRGGFVSLDPDFVAGAPITDCSAFAVPITVDDSSVGVVAVGGRFGRLSHFDQAEIARAIDLVEQLAGSIRNGLLHASVERAAMLDGLTGEANRSAFEVRLAAELRRHRDTLLAVIVIDLNRFKEVNDTLGHHVGDQVLIEFARRVRAELSSDDLLSRFGGDEFAILLRRDTEEEVRQFADRILTMSYTPLSLRGIDAVVTASLGIAYVVEPGTDPASILRQADIAMYAAKNQRIGIEVYREEIDRRTPARLSLLGDLRMAIEHGGLEVHYQPKIELATSMVVGVEALVRWHHEERGWVAPDEFIGAAEESGLIRLVTDVVLTESIRQIAAWRLSGYNIDVSVNLSALDLQDEDLARRIDEKLRFRELDPRHLILEITESALMVDTVRSMATVEQLDALGVRLSLDDFGTGYSSLSYLQRLPVTELKIDQSFVRELVHNVGDDVIVRSTVDLGHNLGLLVVAEGIETVHSFNRLVVLGCDTGQGHGISEPLSPADLEIWLDTSADYQVRLLPAGGSQESVSA